jgi:curved DNA-binding protein
MDDRRFADYYEALQLSPNADLETIQRVYRLQAQRFHPDNPETGDLDTFRLISDAYRTLVDPVQRAAYDVVHRTTRTRHWKIFDQAKAAQGMEAEKRKRTALLSVLYTKRLNDPERPHLSLVELEEVLACPREHLEFGLWYLRETQSIQRSDNARYTITAKGVETLEANDQSPLSPRFLLSEPDPGQS